MCGIHAFIGLEHPPAISPGLEQALRNRGPDHYGQVLRRIEPSGPAITALFTSTVLALRGDHLARQPLVHDGSDSVLCWNGEAWKIADEPVCGNDGEELLARLHPAAPLDAPDRRTHVLGLLRSIQGPFAFVYFDAIDETVYFGRDRLGRRSLLQHLGSDGSGITLCSIPDVPSDGWEEVPSNGVYSIQLGDTDVSKFIFSSHGGVTRHPWIEPEDENLVLSIGAFNEILPSGDEKLDFDSPSVGLINHWLRQSLELRLLNVPEPPQITPQDHDIRVAILFSGGLDCSLLARLAHEVLPEAQGIDLINVAFENPRQAALFRTEQPSSVFYESCPDRGTGRRAFAELKTVCPTRLWRFIAVNVPFEEAMAHKAKVISLIYPHDTEMDFSIALALYFGARGLGDCYTDQSELEPSPPIATTPARVLLSGLGADELFGGYGRHDAAYKRAGYQGLVEQLKLDVSRIGTRNLGRDDRVMTHWGKEVRHPYLDEGFVRLAITTPVWEKCDFGNPFHPAVIEPAKRALRLVADSLGLRTSGREKKRAIQFGSRTAKLESATGRVRGTARVFQRVQETADN